MTCFSEGLDYAVLWHGVPSPQLATVQNRWDFEVTSAFPARLKPKHGHECGTSWGCIQYQLLSHFYQHTVLLQLQSGWNTQLGILSPRVLVQNARLDCCAVLCNQHHCFDALIPARRGVRRAVRENCRGSNVPIEAEKFGKPGFERGWRVQIPGGTKPPRPPERCTYIEPHR